MTSEQIKTHDAVWSHLWRAGLLAAGIAAGANILLYLVARAFGAMPQSVVVPGPGGSSPITLTHVILMTVVPAVVATALLALLVHFTPRPGRIFAVLASFVFVGMLFGPLRIPEAPAKMIVTLELMHLVAVVVTVGLLLRALERMFQGTAL